MPYDTLCLVLSCLIGSLLAFYIIKVQPILNQERNYTKDNEDSIKRMKKIDDKIELMYMTLDRISGRIDRILTGQSNQRVSDNFDRSKELLDAALVASKNWKPERPDPTPMPSEGEPQKKGRDLPKAVNIPVNPGLFYPEVAHWGSRSLQKRR